MDNCIFCRIIEKKAPARLVYESDEYIVIKPLDELAPVHLLVIPCRHISSMNEITIEDAPLAGRLLLAARKAAELGGIKDGFRTVINTGAKGGQTVFHLHIHVLGGARLDNSLITKGLK
jgi:histidine triad (HIT) family protein